MQRGEVTIRKSDIYLRLAQWLAPSRWDAALRVDPDTCWPRVFEAASHHLVTPALAWRMRAAQDLPQPVAEYLEAVLFLNADRNARLADGLGDIGRRLNDAGIIPQLIKGAGLLADNIYPHPGMRFIGDLDLLVPEPQLEDARTALAAGGYRETPDGLDAPDRHQLPMMVHDTSEIGVELHRHPITRALASLADANGLLARGQNVAFEGAMFTLPAPEDRVILAIAHGQVKDQGHARRVPPLRALLDIALHQHRFAAEIDWARIDRRFGSAGMRPLLHDTLALAAALMAMGPPLTLLPESDDAVGRMRNALDRTPSRKLLHALAAMTRAVPVTLAKKPSQQLAALSLRRWRQRLSRFHPRW